MQVPRQRNHPRPAALPDAGEAARPEHDLVVDDGRLVPRELVHAHRVVLVDEVPLLEHAHGRKGRVVDGDAHVGHVAPQALDVAALARGHVQDRQLVREQLLAHVRQLRLVRVPVLHGRVVLGADVHAQEAAPGRARWVLAAAYGLVQPVQDARRQLAHVAGELGRQAPVALELGPVVGRRPRELHTVVETQAHRVGAVDGDAAAGFNDDLVEPGVEGGAPELRVEQDVRPEGRLERLGVNGPGVGFGRDSQGRVALVDEEELGTVGLEGGVEVLGVEHVVEWQVDVPPEALLH